MEHSRRLWSILNTQHLLLRTHTQYNITYVQCFIVFGIVVVWGRLVFAETEVAATAAATTAETTGDNGAHYKAGLQICGR